LNADQKIRKFLAYSRYLVPLVFGCIALAYVSDNNYLPSIDGPTHIYNAKLLGEYLAGNPAIIQTFDLHSFYIPNLFSNYYLMFLIALFGSGIAIQLFYFSLLFLTLYSAYYLFRSFKVPGAFFISLSFIILFNGYLFNNGFYNFSFSVVFLLISIGFFQKHFDGSVLPSKRVHIVLFFLMLLLYYTNALSFIIFLMYAFCTLAVKAFLLVRKPDRSEWKTIQIHIGKFFLLSIPFIVMILLFQFSTSFSGIYQAVDLKGYWRNLIDMSSFIVYDRPGEEPVSFIISLSVFGLFFANLLARLVERRYTFGSGDIMLAIAVTALVLYFTIPDNYSVGMMSARLQFFFYLFQMLWTFNQPGKYLKYLVAIFICAVSFYKYQVHHKPTISELNKNAKSVAEAAKYIEANKTVVVFNYSGNWIELHFSNYLGIEKPMIILENSEAIVRWFPLKWSNERVPTYTLNGNKNFRNFYWNINDSRATQEADYLFMYCGAHLINEDKELADFMAYFRRVDKGELNGVAIFKRK
jgi:hypothetical protein